MARQADNAKFDEVQPAINDINEDKKTIVHRVEVEWQYSDSPEDAENLMNGDHLSFEPSTSKREVHDEAGSKLFTFRSPELKSIKWFLPGTLQRKIPLPLASLLVIATFVYCLHVFGTFGEKTLVEEEMELTLTTFKNIIWTLRIPVFVFFGFCHLKLHLDDIPSSFRLTSSNLKTLKVKIVVCCCFEFFFIVIFPAITRLVQLLWLPTSFEKKDPFNPATATRNVMLLVVARLLSLPIFLSFIAECYLLYYEVKQYEEDIQEWKQGQTEARNYFIDVQKKIKTAEETFQLFLVIHLAILVLIFIPGILSYVERFNAEGTVNRIFLKQQGERMSDPLILINPGTMLNHSSAYRLTKTLLFVNQLQNSNTTEENARHVFQRQTKKMQDKKAQKRILLAALTFLSELMALYLPLILLGKINQTLASIPLTVRYGLKYDEQQESGYLIQNHQVAKEMLRTLEHVEGFQILGMELTVVKTLLIAVFAPLLTLLIHIMIRDVDISP